MTQKHAVNEQLVIAILSAGGGAVLLRLVEWFLSRSSLRDKREDEQATANDMLAAALRKELRDENMALRLRQAEIDGQFNELRKANTAVLEDNYKLQAENARLRAQVEQLLAEIKILRGGA